MSKYIYYVDTESCGYFSPTILIQTYKEPYSDYKPVPIDINNVSIHNIFKTPVKDTVNLIEDITNNYIIGFNLSHDWFHLSRTYNILKLLPQNKVPDPRDILDLEDTDEAHDNYCLKPNGSLDLMIYGRNNELQATMKQKDIIIRRVPKILAVSLVKELEQRIVIPKLYFAKRKGDCVWQIKELQNGTTKEITPQEMKNQEKYGILIDPSFVNIRLSFHPSTGLKPILKYLLGKEIDLIENLIPVPKVTEFSWYPSSGKWINVIHDHIWAWTNDKRRLKYAANDVVYLKDLLIYFKSPINHIIDSDLNYNSMLACLAGSLHWKGFQIDLDKLKKQISVNQEIVDKNLSLINFNAPKEVIEFLTHVATDFEKVMITSSDIDTLNNLLANGSVELQQRTKVILEGRRAYKKLELLKKLEMAKRLYVTFKTSGTKTNRKSGGTNYDKAVRGGSINPQGIPKGSNTREIFTFSPKDMKLDGGDFDGFEVSIAEAVYKDKNLHSDLLSGKSIHALWGSFLYNQSYEEIIKTKGIPGSEPNGYYDRAKESFFAKLYLAEPFTLSNVLLLPEEEIEKGIKNFEDKYTGIKENNQRIYKNYSALSQPVPYGEVIWTEPKKFIESFFGFKRYFNLEYSIIKTLYDLACDPPEEMKKLRIKVKRRERIQTVGGALQSSLFGAAFSLQSSIIRAAGNHEIQTPGGEITKRLEYELWKLQPNGIDEWSIMLFNMHDEILCPNKINNNVEETVKRFIEEYKKYVPMLSMTWKRNMDSWANK